MLASRQPSQTSVRRDAWVEVDLAAIENNVRVVLSWLQPGVELMAVVKSDAYGHGALAVSPILLASGASWLGVASVDEGLQLRAGNQKVPILILSPCPFWAVAQAIEEKLDFTITSASQIKDLAAVAGGLGKQARVHLKVDTGMHRLGAKPSQVAEIVDSIVANPSLEFVGVFSHLAAADDDKTTERQNLLFQSMLTSDIGSVLSHKLIHLASGEAARRFPQTHYDLARVGLYLYGLEPKSISKVVTPALSVRARICHLQDIDPAAAVGYNLTWTAQKPSRIASIPIGYADGVDRRLSNRMKGLLMGQEISQVGLMSMDQMLFDVTSLPQCQVGDVITLIGTDNTQSESPPGKGPATLHLASWASMLDTITYELACRLRVRLPRIYTRGKSAPGQSASA